MKYVVMECHTSFAVVLAEDGRFLNVANMHYQVGQTVNDVFEMQVFTPERRHKRRWFAAIIAIVVCLMMLLAGALFYMRLPYASVYMSINPSVRIDVRKNNEVMDIKAMNDDAKILIAGYSYDDKHLDVVTEELVDLAIQMGYLSDGDEIRISLDTDNDEWESYTGRELIESINDLIDDKMHVNVIIGDDDDDFDYYDDEDDGDDDFDDDEDDDD